MKLTTIKRGSLVATLSVGLLGAGTGAQAAPSPEHTSAAQATQVQNRAHRDFTVTRLIHVRSIGTKCGKKPIAMASGRGKMTLRIDETRSSGTVLSKHIDASNKVISAGVGWDVSKSRSITVSGSKEVPRGKYGTLSAYVKYSGKKFDVEALLMPQGVTWIAQKNKTAYKPIGVCFKYSQR
ncbi:hypothetical protein [Streptomyces sp. M7]|uniref:hypothetical protein n=1 Tax=Streptomyces sp. M7 TaxID=255705 RepID=UPI0011C018B7|nr:hypothetical protein [Streptomyces sp. M7]